MFFTLLSGGQCTLQSIAEIYNITCSNSANAEEMHTYSTRTIPDSDIKIETTAIKNYILGHKYILWFLNKTVVID